MADGASARSMAAVPCGFHTARWARAYEASAREMLGDGADIAPTFVAPLGPDADALAELAAAPETETAARDLEELVGGPHADAARRPHRPVEEHRPRLRARSTSCSSSSPSWRERVVFVARMNPSRESLAEYLAYRNEVEQAAGRVNERWATRDWQPVIVDTRDDVSSTIAALERYDVLLVNPIKDGLNLVAKEGPVVNRRDGVLCLSPDAGAWDELGDAALAAHPYDLEQCAATLHAALSMPAGERAARADRLRELASVHTPRTWLADQLAAAGVTRPG